MRKACLVVALIASSCSDPGANLLRHDTPDVWAGEAWVLDDLLWDGSAPEDLAHDDGLPKERRDVRDGALVELGIDVPIRLVTDGEATVSLQVLWAEASPQIESRSASSEAEGIPHRNGKHSTGFRARPTFCRGGGRYTAVHEAHGGPDDLRRVRTFRLAREQEVHASVQRHLHACARPVGGPAAKVAPWGPLTWPATREGETLGNNRPHAGAQTCGFARCGQGRDLSLLACLVPDERPARHVPRREEPGDTRAAPVVHDQVPLPVGLHAEPRNPESLQAGSEDLSALGPYRPGRNHQRTGMETWSTLDLDAGWARNLCDPVNGYHPTRPRPSASAPSRQGLRAPVHERGPHPEPRQAARSGPSCQARA